MFTRRNFVAGTGAASIAAIAGCMGGDDGDGEYPSQEITGVIPFGAGGSTDTRFRAIAGQMEDELGESIVFDNRGGAGARTGLNYMHDQDPDGYTIGSSYVPTLIGNAVLHPDDTTYSPDTTTGIGTVGAGSMVCCAQTGDYDDFEDLVDSLRNEELALGTTGEGSTGDFASVSMLDALDVDIGQHTWVPFDGGDAGAQGLAAGDVDVIPAQSSTGQQGMVEEGNNEVLLSISEDENPLFPDATTLSDVDYDIPQINLHLGVYGPDGMEDEHVQTLYEAIQAGMETSEWQDFAETNALTPQGLNPDETADLIQETATNAETYRELVQDR